MVDRYASREVFKGFGCASGTQRGERGNNMGHSRCGCGNLSEQKRNARNSMGDKCNCGNKNDCKSLLETLRKIDFSLIDTVLYLDAYPHSNEALAYYHKLKCEREMVVKTLAENCNMPQNSFQNASDTQWLWTDSPWPWEACAN